MNMDRRCRPICTAPCLCHACYICQFVLYLLVFPLWAKWLVTSPMPTENWNQDFPSWPVIPTPAGRAIGESDSYRCGQLRDSEKMKRT